MSLDPFRDELKWWTPGTLIAEIARCAVLSLEARLRDAPIESRHFDLRIEAIRDEIDRRCEADGMPKPEKPGARP